MVTRDAILALEGRELDIAFAEALGFVKRVSGKFLTIAFVLEHPDGRTWYPRDVPLYSSTWDGMGLVATEMKNLGFKHTISYAWGTHQHYAEFYRSRLDIRNDRRSFVNNQEEIPLAVARAALLALQEEE